MDPKKSRLKKLRPDIELDLDLVVCTDEMDACEVETCRRGLAGGSGRWADERRELTGSGGRGG